MENTFCSFSGHRRIPAAALPQLRRLLADKVAELAGEGYTGFLCGGALGFDTLAAEAVLALRVRRPELTLTLALPCPDQDRSWPESDRCRFRTIMESADEVIFTAPQYTRFCMQQRNRFLIDHSRLLVCYLTEMRGGTADTVKYALKQGVGIINLAMELD